MSDAQRARDEAPLQLFVASIEWVPIQLVRTAWSIIAHNTTFDPARLSQHSLT
jgi:hypothetical protein